MRTHPHPKTMTLGITPPPARRRHRPLGPLGPVVAAVMVSLSLGAVEGQGTGGTGATQGTGATPAAAATPATPATGTAGPAAPGGAPRRYKARPLPGSEEAARPADDPLRPRGLAQARVRFQPEAVAREMASSPPAGAAGRTGASAAGAARSTAAAGASGAAARPASPGAAAGEPVAPARVLRVWRRGTFPSTVRPGASGERPEPERAGGGRTGRRVADPPAEGEVRIVPEAEVRNLAGSDR